MRRDHLGLGVSVGRCLLDFLLRVPGRLMSVLRIFSAVALFSKRCTYLLHLGARLDVSVVSNVENADSARVMVNLYFHRVVSVELSVK